MRIGKGKFIVCIAAAFIAGVIVSAAVVINFTGIKEFRKVLEVYDRIDSIFYMETDSDKLIDGACRGMVEALDDTYSSYMTKDEFEEWKAAVTGKYSGVGITFAEDAEGNYAVIAVSKDSPAEKGGIKTGDFILAADGKKYDSINALASAIRGDKGTEVKITYQRDGKENTVSLIRENIVQHSVEYEMLDGKTAYIKVDSFIEDTDEEFSDALEAVEKKGADKLILDLRNNGGGLVDSCINIADEFLAEGLIMYVEAKDGSREDFKAEEGKTELETVVLVNENSASASEILAAALKDNGVAIVGVKTFGKGIIQYTTDLKDGSALELTVLQYFSPKGNAIHKKGIKPDYEVKLDKNSEVDSQLEKAKELLK